MSSRFLRQLLLATLSKTPALRRTLRTARPMVFNMWTRNDLIFAADACLSAIAVPHSWKTPKLVAAWLEFVRRGIPSSRSPGLVGARYGFRDRDGRQHVLGTDVQLWPS